MILFCFGGEGGLFVVNAFLLARKFTAITFIKMIVYMLLK